jgi:TPP-dependent pyruvate/acetoin dehydrogenase alpha subunit
LIATYEKAAAIARKTRSCTHTCWRADAATSHSSSGSHERYKDADRLAWEKDYDCIRQMNCGWLQLTFVSSEEIAEIDSNAKRSPWR